MHSNISFFRSSDFGLTAIQGSNATEQAGSLLWLAPEVIQGGEYTTKSDVYSFGIIVWEIMSRKNPYFDAEHIDSVPVRVVLQQLRPTLPSGTTGDIKDLITDLWAPIPSDRPTFMEISKRLDVIIPIRY